jgi:hypothetical protein
VAGATSNWSRSSKASESSARACASAGSDAPSAAPPLVSAISRLLRAWSSGNLGRAGILDFVIARARTGSDCKFQVAPSENAATEALLSGRIPRLSGWRGRKVLSSFVHTAPNMPVRLKAAQVRRRGTRKFNLRQELMLLVSVKLGWTIEGCTSEATSGIHGNASEVGVVPG